MNLVDIQKALMTDDLATAISGMLAYANEIKNDRLQNQIIHQSSRYHGNERANEMGTLGAEHYNRTRNQLRYALQEIIKRFPDYTPDLMVEAQKLLVEANNPVANPTSDVQPEIDILKILMLTSNPTETAQLKLNDEYALISRNRDAASNPGRFPIVSHQAVTLPEFTKYLYAEKPVIVHFSGHGEQNNANVRETIRRGQGLDDEQSLEQDNTGILLTSPNKRDPFFVGTSVIRQIFSTMIQKRNIPIQAVIFNSCYSEAQAEAIADLVPHVIGTSWSVSDEAAIAFANGFYSFFIQTEDYEAAWDDGVIQALAYGEPRERFIYFKNGEKVSS